MVCPDLTIYILQQQTKSENYCRVFTRNEPTEIKIHGKRAARKGEEKGRLFWQGFGNIGGMWNGLLFPKFTDLPYCGLADALVTKDNRKGWPNICTSGIV